MNNNQMKSCHLCHEGSIKELIDFGAQPICNRFLKNRVDKELLHPLILGQCRNCGLVQLIDPVSAKELLPHYDWITYIEPEEHLDSLTDTIVNLPDLKKDSRICGISFKDDSLLERLEKRGFTKTYRISPENDLGIREIKVGVETIQDKMTPQFAIKLAETHGPFDVVIARHILEHSHEPLNFYESLKNLLNPEGYIVIEVPDCLDAIENLDYATIWEEHITYFTTHTFRSSFSFAGFSLAHFKNYPYLFENSLTGIARIDENAPVSLDKKELEKELKTADKFSAMFENKREKTHRYLSDFRDNHGEIALLGAGHFACAFVNMLHLSNLIECVIDDNPNKDGLYMPGSRLPINNSGALVKKNIKLCLLGLNPSREEIVIQKNRDFTENMGIFKSIFAVSKNSLFNQTTPDGSDLIHMNKINDSVYYAKDNIVKVKYSDIDWLLKKVKDDGLEKIRICTHRNVDDRINEMFILLTDKTYIRAHRHNGKSESFHIIDGTADVIVFDNEGGILNIIPLGDHSSGRNFYCRLSDPFFHTILVKSDYIIFQETTNGPFRREETEFASWAPDETDINELKIFQNNLFKKINKFNSNN